MPKNGYSLLELLVVMAIVAILFGVGTAGLMRLQETMRAEQGVSQLSSILKSEKNKAKNNVIDESVLKTGLGVAVFNNLNNYMLGTRLSFEVGNPSIIHKSVCWRELSSNWVGFGSSTNCILEEDISLIGGIYFTNPLSNACQNVLIENLTEKIYLDSMNECSLDIVTSTFSTPPLRQLFFNKALGTYEIVTP